ncbi:MAG TPA: FecR family protein [Stellaceae bacterium]|nr:FecR family protein [Stellaceae bacterium]
MPARLSVALLSALLLVFSCLLARPAAADAAGEVLVFSGQPVVVRGSDRVPLKMGDTVNVGDAVEVPEGGKLRLRMGDGSVLTLASGSRMTIQSYTPGGAGQPRDVRLGLPSGLVQAVVAPVAQPSRFEVDTATAVAAVRSTDWFIDARAGTTQVAVLDGTVDLTSRATGKAVPVPPRQGTRVDAGRDVLPPRVYSQAEFDQLLAQTSFPAGWCQCIDARNTLQGACLADAGGCQAYCAPGHYSFVPVAPGTCPNGPSRPIR